MTSYFHTAAMFLLCGLILTDDWLWKQPADVIPRSLSYTLVFVGFADLPASAYN